VGEGAQSARPEVLAARAEVLASLGKLDEELVRLEASARAAVDIKAKVKRSPAKAAGAAAGTAFLVVGGPRRVLRRTRNAIFGAPNPLPPSMLPKDVDKALSSLGTDGDKVRGAIEREFAAYLQEKTPELKSRNLPGSVAKLVTTFGRPIAFRYGVKMANEILSTDNAQFADRLASVRQKGLGSSKPKQGS
jgi:hypothetical protein